MSASESLDIMALYIFMLLTYKLSYTVHARINHVSIEQCQHNTKTKRLSKVQFTRNTKR